MPWIETVAYKDADAKLKPLYDRVKGPDNNVDNIMMMHSLRPHSMEGHMALYKNVLHHSGNALPKWVLEMIGVSTKAIKSGSLKAVPSPLEPLSPRVEAATQSLVTDMYTMFRDMVLRRRGLGLARDSRTYAQESDSNLPRIRTTGPRFIPRRRLAGGNSYGQVWHYIYMCVLVVYIFVEY